MEVRHLIKGLDIKTKIKVETTNLMVNGIADNSLEVKRNFVFVAIEGFSIDGHTYINDAIKKGACVVIGEKDLSDIAVPYLKVNNSRKALGIIASNFYGNPSKHKVTIGITGTNGKTTTSHLLRHIIEKSGRTCSMIGTIQNVINGEVSKGVNTTPSSLVLQKLLAISNDDIIIMEVSSHGLEQYRLEGMQFDFCLFTNLDHDHLDYHASMEKYFQTKLLLFEKLKISGQAIINTDNFWGERLAGILQSKGREPFTIGQSENNKLEIIDFNYQNSTIKFKESNVPSYLYSPMPGAHNMYNTIMAYGVALLLNLNRSHIHTSIYDFVGVDGRFEILKQDNSATVVIDYAHTADAFLHCLKAAKVSGAKKLIHVFGFRGNRDSSKRQEMLSVTSEISDQYIVTLEDLNNVPYDEMVRTMEYLNSTFGNEKGSIVVDRTLAIKTAMDKSNPGDWIIITGKGHEKYQQNYHLPTNSDKETVTFLHDLQKHSDSRSFT